MKQKYFFGLVIVFLFIAVFVTGCNFGTLINKPPVISELKGETQVKPGATINLICSASDANQDNLSYSWSANGGTLATTEGASVSWAAPNEEGECTISVIVSDGKLSVSQDIVITVGNATPVITDLIASSLSVFEGENVNFEVVASDEDGDLLTYRWEVSGGTIESGQNTASLSWSSSIEGDYTITVYVSDGVTEISSSIIVTVYTGGLDINFDDLLNLDTYEAYTRQLYTLNIIVHDSYHSSVDVQVTPTSGTLNLINSNSPSFDYTWTSPDTAQLVTFDVTISTVDYVITKSFTVNVNLNNDPIIEDILVDGVSIIDTYYKKFNVGQTYQIEIKASDPDGDSLACTWKLESYEHDLSESYTGFTGSFTAYDQKMRLRGLIHVEDSKGGQVLVYPGFLIDDGTQDIADTVTIGDIESIIHETEPLLRETNITSLQAYFHPDNYDLLTEYFQNSFFPPNNFIDFIYVDRDIISYDSATDIYTTNLFYSISFYDPFFGMDLTGIKAVNFNFKRDSDSVMKIYNVDNL